MVHTTRHSRKRKKPKRTQSVRWEGDTLREHRELQMLRIAGGAKPGGHKDNLLATRIDKLNAVDPRFARDEPKPVDDSMFARIAALREYYERKAGRLA